MATSKTAHPPTTISRLQEAGNQLGLAVPTNLALHSATAYADDSDPLLGFDRTHGQDRDWRAKIVTALAPITRGLVQQLPNGVLQFVLPLVYDDSGVYTFRTLTYNHSAFDPLAEEVAPRVMTWHAEEGRAVPDRWGLAVRTEVTGLRTVEGLNNFMNGITALFLSLAETMVLSTVMALQDAGAAGTGYRKMMFPKRRDLTSAAIVESDMTASLTRNVEDAVSQTFAVRSLLTKVAREPLHVILSEELLNDTVLLGILARIKDGRTDVLDELFQAHGFTANEFASLSPTAVVGSVFYWTLPALNGFSDGATMNQTAIQPTDGDVPYMMYSIASPEAAGTADNIARAPGADGIKYKTSMSDIILYDIPLDTYVRLTVREMIEASSIGNATMPSDIESGLKDADFVEPRSESIFLDINTNATADEKDDYLGRFSASRTLFEVSRSGLSASTLTGMTNSFLCELSALIKGDVDAIVARTEKLIGKLGRVPATAAFTTAFLAQPGVAGTVDLADIDPEAAAEGDWPTGIPVVPVESTTGMARIPSRPGVGPDLPYGCASIQGVWALATQEATSGWNTKDIAEAQDLVTEWENIASKLRMFTGIKGTHIDGEHNIMMNMLARPSTMPRAIAGQMAASLAITPATPGMIPIGAGAAAIGSGAAGAGAATGPFVIGLGFANEDATPASAATLAAANATSTIANGLYGSQIFGRDALVSLVVAEKTVGNASAFEAVLPAAVAYAFVKSTDYYAVSRAAGSRFGELRTIAGALNASEFARFLGAVQTATQRHGVSAAQIIGYTADQLSGGATTGSVLKAVRSLVATAKGGAGLTSAGKSTLAAVQGVSAGAASARKGYSASPSVAADFEAYEASLGAAGNPFLKPTEGVMGAVASHITSNAISQPRVLVASASVAAAAVGNADVATSDDLEAQLSSAGHGAQAILAAASSRAAPGAPVNTDAGYARGLYLSYKQAQDAVADGATILPADPRTGFTTPLQTGDVARAFNETLPELGDGASFLDLPTYSQRLSSAFPVKRPAARAAAAASSRGFGAQVRMRAAKAVSGGSAHTAIGKIGQILSKSAAQENLALASSSPSGSDRLAMLFLFGLRIDTKDTFYGLAARNTMLPTAFFLLRPNLVVTMRSAVACLGGTATGSNRFNNVHGMEGQVASRKMLQYNVTLNYVAIIQDPNRVVPILNLACGSYVSGGSVTLDHDGHTGDLWVVPIPMHQARAPPAVTYPYGAPTNSSIAQLHSQPNSGNIGWQKQMMRDYPLDDEAGVKRYDPSMIMGRENVYTHVSRVKSVAILGELGIRASASTNSKYAAIGGNAWNADMAHPGGIKAYNGAVNKARGRENIISEIALRGPGV